MVNGIRTIYPHGLSKAYDSKFRVGSRVQHKKPEKGRRTQRPKRCKYNNKHEGKSPNTLNYKNHQISSQKFIKITEILNGNKGFLN